jgi:transposase
VVRSFTSLSRVWSTLALRLQSFFHAYLRQQVLVGQIRHLNDSIRKLEAAIKKQGPKLPGYRNLKSIKGLGDIGSSTLLSTIGDINDFASEGQLAA